MRTTRSLASLGMTCGRRDPSLRSGWHGMGDENVRMKRATLGMLTVCLVMSASCAGARGSATPSPEPAASAALLAQIYAWRAKPGKLAEYTRYIRDVAEPIDHEAQRTGAFISVTTYESTDSLNPW